MTAINLLGPEGEPLGRLRAIATDLIEEAERTALDRGMSKRLCLPVVLREHVEQAGYTVTELEIARAASQLETVRHGEHVVAVEIRIQSVAADQPPAEATCGPKDEKPMPARKPQGGAIQFFELEQEYPNDEARAWYERLVGLDDHKRRLLVELELLLYPERVEAWSRKHHKTVIRLCSLLRQRVPLVLLEGDVGCGKTALAETVGDPLARHTGGKVHLLKVNTQVRGSGHVGEMTDLIVQAFAQAEQRVDSLKGQPVLLLIDEADALAAKRVDLHMHHEDKAGMNTLLQRIDNLRLTKRRIAVIFITNRPDALDPAVHRRAALRLTFGRPNDESREAIIRLSLPELDLTTKNAQELVRLTGPAAKKNKGIGFTPSDITDRLLPSALREAYHHGRPISAADLIALASEIEPSPRMGSDHDEKA
jgi:SpoVK/Ycf46/Vps4 family AAA+-type ATPase